MAGLTGWHLLIILGVVVLLFGAAKLPTLAKSVGQSMRIFKGEMKQMKDDGQASADGPADGKDAASSTEKAEHGSQPHS